MLDEGEKKGSPVINRVEITPAASEAVERLRAQYGPLIFHQSGGCCDGSSPMCYPAGDFRVGPQDVFLGQIAHCDFYIGAAQFDYWKHTQLIIDVVRGAVRAFRWKPQRGCGFSHAAGSLVKISPKTWRRPVRQSAVIGHSPSSAKACR